MSIKAKFTTSVNQAVKDGRIDRKKHGALIEVARKMAERMDDPDWPMVNGKYDNVTESMYLKYCEKLHLTPAETKPEKKYEAGALIGNSKWAKDKTANEQ